VFGDPYHTLDALHEVMDQPRQALNFYMIAAHMSGKVSKGTAADLIFLLGFSNLL
jgi:hypothetical protein